MIMDMQSSLLSNLKNSERKLILKAAKETGFNVYIIDKATYGNNITLEGYFGSHSGEREKDAGPMWKRFDELKGR